MIRGFSPKQKTVLTWWTQSSPYQDREIIICDGAVRSGKTLCMSLGFVFWSMRCFTGEKFGFCGKTIASLRRNILADLTPILTNLGFRCSQKRSDNTLTIRFGGNENTYYFFGGRDESSAALIQGITFAGVLLDEVVLMPRSFVEQACARCSVTGSRIWMSCNPEGPQHWFYTDWILRADQRNALYLHFTMDDNPALSRRIRERYRKQYTGVFYRRFVLGEWVVASGRVYDFFDTGAAPPPPAEPCERYCVSCDYGTVNPASFGLWGEKGGVWYRLREYYWDSRRESRQKTDAEYAADLRAFVGGRTLRAVVVDPSAASFIEVLRREGFPVVRAVNDVLSGIRVTADLLKTGRIVICATCSDCLREMEEYVWDTSAGGRDAVKKEHDHAMDDMRYFAATIVSPPAEPFAAVAVLRR